MKKIFTLIAATLMAVGANAQTYITFDETGTKVAGEVSELTLGDANFKVALVGGSKAKIDAKSLTFKTAEDATAESFAYQWCPGGGIKKTSGERSITITVSKAGTLTIYPRSASSDDRPFTVEQGGSVILSDGMAYNGKAIADTYYKAYAVTVAAGTVNIKCEDAVNFSGFKFEATGGDTPATSLVCGSAAANETIPTGGTDCKSISFGTAATATLSITTVDEAFRAANVSAANMAVRGINIDGTDYDPIYFLSTSGTSSHKFNLTKSANVTKITMYARKNDGTATNTVTIRKNDVEGDVIVVANGFGGHLVSAEVTDVATLYVPAGTYIAFKVEYTTGTGISTTMVSALKADGKWYNLQGQEVAAPTKGIFIKNGKKYVIK